MMREVIFPSVRETYSDLHAAARHANFLVVGELLYVAPMVAATRDIPWANAILAPTSFLSACDPCVLAPAPLLHHLRHLGSWTHQLIFRVGRSETLRWSRPLQDFHRERGFPDHLSPVFDGKHSPHLVLALFPSFLAAPQSDWPAPTLQTGFPFFSQPLDTKNSRRLKEFLEAGGPPVVFTLGSLVVHFARNFYQIAAEAAAEIGCRAILLTGRGLTISSPGRDVLALDYAPLESVLPHAAAVVHQGGIGTCAESLRAGIPSLIIPFGFDQPDNANRLRKLGVAKVLSRRRLNTESLTVALRELLASTRLTGNAARYASRIHPATELASALVEIERIQSGRSAKYVVQQAA